MLFKDSAESFEKTETTGQKKSITYAFSMRNEYIIAPFGYTGTCDSKLFLKWVQEMLVPNLKENQIVIMDNATIHKSPKIIGISLSKDSGESLEKTETTEQKKSIVYAFQREMTINPMKTPKILNFSV